MGPLPLAAVALRVLLLHGRPDLQAVDPTISCMVREMAYVGSAAHTQMLCCMLRWSVLRACLIERVSDGLAHVVPAACMHVCRGADVTFIYFYI